MKEYGLFSDEGCVERGFWSMGEAVDESSRYSPEDALHVGEVCDECEGEIPFCGEDHDE